jgi:hypothetical protein
MRVTLLCFVAPLYGQTEAIVAQTCIINRLASEKAVQLATFAFILFPLPTFHSVLGHDLAARLPHINARRLVSRVTEDGHDLVDGRARLCESGPGKMTQTVRRIAGEA